VIASSVAGFRILLASSVPPLYDDYLRHAELSEAFGLSHDGDYLLVAASPATREWPSLVVEQRYDPGNRSGFTPGVHLITETSILLIGAGTRLLAYDISKSQRVWQDETHGGFWSWAQHHDTVVLSAELEIAAWDLRARKLWSRVVEPPWTYKVVAGTIELDVMGDLTSFAITEGPPPR
jgi:hypothetical protein